MDIIEKSRLSPERCHSEYIKMNILSKS